MSWSAERGELAAVAARAGQWPRLDTAARRMAVSDGCETVARLRLEGHVSEVPSVARCWNAKLIKFDLAA